MYRTVPEQIDHRVDTAIPCLHYCDVGYEFQTPIYFSMAFSEEYLTQLRTVFDLCDETKRGFITRQQFDNLSKKYFGTDDTLECLFHPGNSGVIEFDDFCRGVSSIVNSQVKTNDVEELITYEGTEQSLDGVSCATYNEYDVADLDDVMNSQLRNNDNEGSQDGDSAIEVAPVASLGSPDSDRKNLLNLSDNEEKFECFGDSRWETDEKMPPNCDSSPERNRLHQPFRQRNMWIRNSLRRSPSEKKQMSLNSRSGHVNRSSSFNSSRRSSSCDSDEMNGDFAVEDDVYDLREKIQGLQHQVTALATGQTNSEEKYNKVKQENASLMARIHSLEEQIREVEIRSEDRIKEEHQRFKEVMARQDKEKCLEIESFTLRLHTLERENQVLNADLLRLRSQLDKIKYEKMQLQDQLSEAEFTLTNTQEENRRLQDLCRREREESAQTRANDARVIDELTKEVGELRRYKAEMGCLSRARSPSVVDLPSRYAELQDQMAHLRRENHHLKDENDELQAQLLNSSIQEGRNLLHGGATTNSLAAEFDAMTKDEITQKLKDQQDVNAKLKLYIDNMLLSILENHPSILERRTINFFNHFVRIDQCLERNSTPFNRRQHGTHYDITMTSLCGPDE
uniref:FIP-RBD domain-containing protein n=1 Tax=Strigamia maritima TaxID=126957 RepID=T1JCU2_STRMM